MRHHLLIACCFTAACYHDSAPAPAHPPGTPIVAAPRGLDVSATIADPLGFLPVDSEVVVSLDADQLRQSPLWTQLEASISAKGGSDLTMFKAMCGFDPLVAVRGLSIAVRDVSAPTPDGVFVVHGVDRAKMVGCLQRVKGLDAGVTLDADGVVTVRKAPDPDVLVFQFVGPSTAVGLIGPTANRRVLETVVRGGAPLRSSPAFIEMFQTINTDGTAWAVVNGTGHVFDKAAALGVKPRAVFGSLSAVDGLSMNVRLRLSTPQEAGSLVAMAQGQLGTAKMLFDKLDVTADDADVVIALAMTSSQLQMISGLVGGLSSP